MLPSTRRRVSNLTGQLSSTHGCPGAAEGALGRPGRVTRAAAPGLHGSLDEQRVRDYRRSGSLEPQVRFCFE